MDWAERHDQSDIGAALHAWFCPDRKMLGQQRYFKPGSGGAEACVTRWRGCRGDGVVLPGGVGD
jgi:hypothetical protein